MSTTSYIGASDKVYGYDLRYHAAPSATQTKSSPIISKPDFDMSNQFQCTDEINQLSFSFKKHYGTKKEYFMSAACDSGDVHLCQDVQFQYNQQDTNEQSPKLLHHADPGSQAIASCASFRPRVNDVQIASCGTDCTVKLWDAKKTRQVVVHFLFLTILHYSDDQYPA